jgi:potassium/hydrogen antiporter
MGWTRRAPAHPAAKLVRGYQNLFMCWTRETGVIPAALAGLLLGMKAPGAQMVASITFIAILMTILIEAPTTKWLGRKLGLLEENKMYRSS